jgi:CubicO group peptidase (beta-lactamase class C family)
MVPMVVRRRTVLSAGLGAAATLAGCGSRPTTPVWSSAVPSPSGAVRPAPTVRPTSPEDLVFSPGRVLDEQLRPAPYAAALSETVRRYLQPTRENPKHPVYPGAVVLASVDGQLTALDAVGDALRFGVGPVELPAAQRVPMRTDSIFDLASITKVFVAVLVLQQVDRGTVALDAPVVRYLPEFTGGGKDRVTVAMLLSHTAGVAVGAQLQGQTIAARWASVLAMPLIKGAVPGNTLRYSSVGLMILGRLLEKVTGKPLDALTRTELTEPLGLRDTGFTPLKWLAKADQETRLVATDARPARGLLRGVVHDGVADRLGGVAGHAGLFSTARDLAILGQLLLNGGEYGGHRVLAESTVRAMLRNVNAGLPAIDAERPNRSADHGLGVELNQPWFAGGLAAPLTFGHTGFTGTCLLVEPYRRLVLILLANRAHPDWTRANPDYPRIAVANVLADALPA